MYDQPMTQDRDQTEKFSRTNQEGRGTEDRRLVRCDTENSYSLRVSTGSYSWYMYRVQYYLYYSNTPTVLVDWDFCTEKC